MEEDVRVDGSVGVGNGSSVGKFRKELRVEDRPRRPPLVRDGEDWVEVVEPLRKSWVPGPASMDLGTAVRDGEGNGDAKPVTSSTDGELSACTADDSASNVLVELLGCDAGGASEGFDF